MKLLMITPEKEIVMRFIPQLERVGYQVHILTDTKLVNEAIDHIMPDVVMVSLRLGVNEGLSLYKRILHQLARPCMIYSEDTSRKTTNLLLNSRIPHVLFPPLSAHGIHRRVQLLTREFPKFAKFKEASSLVLTPSQEVQRKREVFLNHVASVLNFVQPPKADPSNEFVLPKARALISRVSWLQQEGYLTVAYNERHTEAEVVESIHKALTKYLVDTDAAEVSVDAKFEIDLRFDLFKGWAQKCADMVVVDDSNTLEIMVAFVGVRSLPNVSPTLIENYSLVDLDGWLRPNTRLPFDVFIHLPANSRFVLYMRKDDMLSSDTLERFNKVGLERSFVSPSDFHNLFRYCMDLKKQAA